ncbi:MULTISPECIES: helix-hairpin-helix domain-containing protein [Bacteroides]|uniref:helix-hairpin-helix domain-containing protein n=1 Tax=Bacteroides TaxID=816 RepID=UPI000E448E47|nr:MULTISPECIES: helix-hairpin-helix domain-containing protein [Bacteroides]RGM50040.1 helix-hairpin-helix domain-containing protein [Bacteroides sp. OM08-11]
MKFFKMGVFVSMLLMTPVLEAQNTTVSLWEENLEQLFMDGEERNWENELEELSRHLQEPININSATKQQLEQFPFLTDIQIENILAYIYIHGQMQTVYELQLVEEMDKYTIELLLPFVCVQPVKMSSNYPSLKTLLKYGKQEVLTRLDIPLYTRKGYKDNYLGPSMYHSFRYNFHYGEYLQTGIVSEKDAGEPLFALHNRKGYDYCSFYFLLKNLRRLKSLALGNYRLSFGQGLVLSTDFRLGKTFSLSTSEYRTGGIRKHSSTDEYNYFRGAAATIGILSFLEMSVFYSHRSMDGVLKDGEITSIYKTGLHRTQKEADKKNIFSLQLMGGNLTYEKNKLKLGFTGIYYFFNHPYEPKLNKYARYNLHGNYFYNLGVDYKYRLGRLAWVGEAAMGKSGYALLNQLKYKLLTGYQLLLIHRYYSYNYWSFFARSFGESSTPQNENGWYLATEANPFPHWKFFVSFDLFSFPWWKYRISKPSQGVDVLFQVSYSFKRNLSMYFNYRYKQKERDVSGTDGKTILPIYQHRFRYRLTYTPRIWKLQTTLDYNHFHSQGKERSRGYQCTQSCGYAFPGFPLSVSVQGTYFHTDDYDSRIYTYEKGLLNTFYVPSFYGTGFRYSAHLRYDLNKTFMFLVKFGQTIYQDRETIGSGNDLIQGDKKADLQMQLRIKF